MGYEHYNDTDRPIDHIDKKPSDPYGIQSTKIDSGIRKTLNTCQYWIKGLPGVCEYWSPGDPGNCTYQEISNITKLRVYPSGWNKSHCDFLGRQYSCDKYTLEGDEDLDQYICVAPNFSRSGLLKRDSKDDPWRAVRKSEVRGYNADSEFVGRCDGCGFGRGEQGYNYSSAGEDCGNEEFRKLPSICNYYRPYHISFGAKTPKTSTLTFRKTRTKVDKKTGQVVGDEREYFEERLPFSFKIYNVRAKLQKCAHWNADEGSDFVNDTAGLYLDGGDLCTNPDEAALPYHTLSPNAPADRFLENVWSSAGSIICNGARSDCPGYTGRWIYCVDEYMEKGDKISAQQILELRFWMHDWASREEYDSVFRRPPNKSDPDTSDIYTYHKWDSISTRPVDSILLGKRCSLCVPNASNEFSADTIQTEEIIFKKPGTAAPSTKRETPGTVPTVQTPPKANEIGPPQVEFPNLIRDVEFLSEPPLDIVYPYATKDPWDEEKNPVCGEGEWDTTPCVKRYYSVDGDSISVVGFAIRNQTIYVFNATEAGYDEAPSQLRSNTTSAIFDNIRTRIKFNEEMDEFVRRLDEKSCLHETTSDVNGLFVAGPIDIEYKKLNELVVCYKYNDDWYFRKRSVWSQWHGGIIIQKNFTHKYGDGLYIDDGYSVFTPPAEATAEARPLHSINDYELKTDTGAVFKCSKKLVYSSIIDYYYRYDFCLKKITKKDVEITRWKRADNAGTLWIEIDDTNLNYIFYWGVTKAKAELIDEDDNVQETIEFEVVLPNSSHAQSNIHANACMLKPKNNIKRGFFRLAGWKITADYWYTEISSTNSVDEGEEIYYPDFSSPINKFSPGTHDISISGNNITANNIQSNTIAIMSLFVDEDGRIVSAFATKLVVDVARVFSRDVEIRYGWKADYTTYELRPQSGFLRLDEDGPFRAEAVGSSSMMSVIPCGDHEMGEFSGTGPMWFPYNSCETIDFYDIWTGANSVVKPHEGTPRFDYRYMTPIENRPFCAPHSTLWDCAEDWGCGYHKIAPISIRFIGYARYRGYVNPLEYYAFGWSMPKFGNVLREYVERFRCIDNDSHISYAGPEPSKSIAWMPLVMDDSCFFYDFGSFDKDTNEIVYMNQLNFMLLQTNVSEQISKSSSGSYSRYRFDDLFDIRRVILASYPLPIIESGLSFPFVAFYCFNEDSTQWVWQERWREIDRQNKTLRFVVFDRPTYLFDYNKKEHRLITEENTATTIEFTAPEWNEVDAILTRWPSLKLSGGYERWFRCVYDSYDSSMVDWEDENEGEVDGSGGSDDGNIYEKCNESDWIHAHPDKYPDLNNMLFDSGASDNPSEARNGDREVSISYDSLLEETESYVYNRGVVAKITKNRLKYMPYGEESFLEYTVIYSVEPNISIEGSMASWQDVRTVDIDFDFSPRTAGWPCVSKVHIYGKTGNESVNFEGEDVTVNINQPAISIYENGSSTSLAYRDAVYLIEDEKQAGLGLNLWDKEIKIQLDPTRMLTESGRTHTLKIRLYSAVGAISISQIVLYTATYKDETEQIGIYERKYIKSVGSYGDYNPDGPGRHLLYEHNRDNSGVYWNETAAPSDKVRAHGKMRKISGGESKEDKEKLPTISNHGDLLEAEKEQQIIYESALEYEDSNKVVYNTSVPPPWEDHITTLGVLNHGLNAGSVTFESEKMKWKNNMYADGYKSYPTWSPRGYYYRWAEQVRLAKCYIIDDLHEIAQLEFLDVAENSSKYAATGVQSYYSLRAWHQVLQTEKNLFIGGDAAHQANEQQFKGFIDLVTGGGRS